MQQFIVSDLSDIGEEAIIMFEEEGGVGAEEVVGTEEFVTCFVDSSQVRKSGRTCCSQWSKHWSEITIL